MIISYPQLVFSVDGDIHTLMEELRPPLLLLAPWLAPGDGGAGGSRGAWAVGMPALFVVLKIQLIGLRECVP